MLSTVKITCWDSSRLKIICPALRASETLSSAILAETGVHRYSDSHIELGRACEKHRGAGTWVTTDPGNSDIIRSMPEYTGDKKTKKVL